MGASLDAHDAQGHHGLARCFKCPRERREGDPGWYFVDLLNPRKIPGPARLYVCPQDYLDFSAGERQRWMPLPEMPSDLSAQAPSDGSKPAGAGAPTRTADELIAVLVMRGLAGWAFLVRDVAQGRVRRLHLRQLPADPEIREALLTYLQSAGASVTVSRSVGGHTRRSRRGR